MRTFIITALVLGLVLLISTAVTAQAPPPPMLPGMPSQSPIDSGLGLLAAAGGAYAWKKLRNKSKE